MQMYIIIARVLFLIGLIAVVNVNHHSHNLVFESRMAYS